MTKPNIKQIILGVVVILILGFVVWNFFLKSSPSIPSDILTPSNDEVLGQDILILIDKFKSISIDASIFSSTLFTSLKDSSIILIPEAQGRSNPFAPIGVDAAPAVNTNTQTKSPGI